MNELDAIQEQMAGLGIDVGGEQMPMDAYGMGGYDVGGQELTDEELAMFQPGGQFGEPIEEAAPGDLPPEDVMPEYDMEELKIDITPMLSGLPKDALADLIIWIGQERTNLNSNNEAENA